MASVLGQLALALVNRDTVARGTCSQRSDNASVSALAKAPDAALDRYRAKLKV